MIAPPKWTSAEIVRDIQAAILAFRQERIGEPLAAYLEACETYLGSMDKLFVASENLTQMERRAEEILTQSDLLETFRYLTGPPLSADDLKTLSEAVLSPSRLRNDSAMAQRILEVVRIGLDSRRFPWVLEGRSPTDVERSAGLLASAVLMATSRAGTIRRNKGKKAQESLVEQTLEHSGLTKVNARVISTLNHAPGAGEFCRESLLGTRKADLVVRLWDHRLMAIECKVSNSALNSIKRVNNDASVKAETWIKDFGTRNVVPVAVLSGVYKVRNLIDAQERGLTMFWAHNLNAMAEWIGSTRT